MNDQIQKKVIENHEVYIFEEHHYALFPWAEIKNITSKQKWILFSLDYHTDILEPFLHYCECNEKERQELIDRIVLSDKRSIKDAVQKLKHDEHIKTALKTGIFEKAFIISHVNSFDFPMSIQEKNRLEKWQNNDSNYILQCVEGNYGITPITERTYEQSDIYMPPFLPEGVTEYRGQYDNDVLEDGFLSDKMFTLSRMCPEIISKEGNINCNYVLDIDLDYFRTMKSVNPLSKKYFRDW